MLAFSGSIYATIAFALIGWSNFEGVRFHWEYRDEVGAEVQMPTFTKKVLALEGKEIELQGYYLPMDLKRKHVILSKDPFSSCFFCGGAGGPETVAEVHFKEVPPRFAPDQIVFVRGILKLNPDDFDHLVFIIEDAQLISS
jgi:hypothetical protein